MTGLNRETVVPDIFYAIGIYFLPAVMISGLVGLVYLLRFPKELR